MYTSKREHRLIYEVRELRAENQQLRNELHRQDQLMHAHMRRTQRASLNWFQRLRIRFQTFFSPR